jgi:hypothetical protein
MTHDADIRHLQRHLPTFRDVRATPGTHFAVRAEGLIVRLVVGPKGGIRFRRATDEELNQLAID